MRSRRKWVGSLNWLQKFLMKFSSMLEFLSNFRNEFSFFSSAGTVLTFPSLSISLTTCTPAFGALLL